MKIQLPLQYLVLQVLGTNDHLVLGRAPLKISYGLQDCREYLVAGQWVSFRDLGISFHDVENPEKVRFGLVVVEQSTEGSPRDFDILFPPHTESKGTRTILLCVRITFESVEIDRNLEKGCNILSLSDHIISFLRRSSPG